MTAASPSFVCPACRGDVRRSGDGFVCEACPRTYPVVLGIPDFRLAPDPWISIEEDRAKGVALDAATRGATFAESVAAYWRMTPSTPPERAARFTAHVLDAGRRTEQWLAREGLAAREDAAWIDLGCGTADLAAAAPAGQDVIGVDVAFRWLVVAARRLGACGRPVRLVCANAEALPFQAGAARRVLALGLLEHVADPVAILREARRILQPGGSVHLRTTNRFSLLREPHVNLWGVGFLPRRAAAPYVRWRNGASYVHHHPHSARELRRALAAAGFTPSVVRAAALLDADRERLGGLRALSSVYGALARWPPASTALAAIAPLLDARGEAA